MLFLLLLFGSGCDSQTGSTVRNEQVPSIAELRSKAKDLGINPDHVNFDRMYELGDFNTFVDLSAPISGQQLREMQARWPDKFENVSTERGSTSKEVFAEPPYYDQEDACWYYGPYYDTEFCECVRIPSQCTEDPSYPPNDDDDGSSGGGDDEDSDDNGNSCAGISEATEDFHIYYGSELDAFADDSGYVHYQGYSWTRGDITGWDNLCYGINAQIQARVSKWLQSGDTQVIDSKSSSPTFTYDDVHASFQGTIGSYGLGMLQLSANHSVEFQFLGIAGDTATRYSESQYLHR